MRQRCRRMQRTIKPFLFLVISAVFCVPGLAQKLPGLLPGALTGGEEKAPSIQPQATDLNPGWWHYFNTADDELQARVEQTISSVDQLVSTLPAQKQSDAQALLDLIRANLMALPGARKKQPQQPPAPPAYAKTYTPAQWLSLSRRLRNFESQLEVETTDIRIDQNNLEDTLRQNETQSAAYLELPTSDPDKAMIGLQIMADRTAMLVVEERLRLKRAEIAALRKQRDFLTAELDVARSRLSASQGDLSRLEDDIRLTVAERQNAQAKIISEKAKASSIEDDTLESRATAQYRQQRVIRAEIAEAQLHITLIELNAKYRLSQLLISPERVSTAINSEISTWASELQEISANLSIWTNASERERRRASSATSTDGEQLDLPGYLNSLNQNRVAFAQESLVAIRDARDKVSQAQLAIELIDQLLLRQQGLIKRWMSYIWLGLIRASDNAATWANISLFTIGDTPVTALGLLRIAVILTLAWSLSYWIRRMLERLGSRSDPSNLAAFYTIGRLSHYLIILFGFLIGLTSIGMDFSNFALVAGALAIGIGFGLQAIVNNFISGLILLFERSLKVGDFVELSNGVAGEVKTINVRSTQIKTNENIDIVVPNSEFMNSNVINWTLQEPYRRVHYPFRIAFKMDKDLVRRAGLEAAENVSHTLSGIPGKNPQVWLVGFGDNGYIFELVVWLTPSAVKRPQAVRAAYYWELETALKKYKIEVPIPQRDVYLHQGHQADAS